MIPNLGTRMQVALITGMLPDCSRNSKHEAEQLQDSLPEQLQDKITVATVDSYQASTDSSKMLGRKLHCFVILSIVLLFSAMHPCIMMLQLPAIRLPCSVVLSAVMPIAVSPGQNVYTGVRTEDMPSVGDVLILALFPWLQGLEKPVIILSTAVTRPGNFVGDAQRLNVALTRAKHHLIVVSASYTIICFPSTFMPQH